MNEDRSAREAIEDLRRDMRIAFLDQESKQARRHAQVQVSFLILYLVLAAGAILRFIAAFVA